MSINVFRPGRSDGAPTPGHALPLNLDNAVTPHNVEKHIKMFGVGGYERNGVVVHSHDDLVHTFLLRVGRERFANFHLAGRPDVGYDGYRQSEDFQGRDVFMLSPDRKTTLFGYEPTQLELVMEQFRAGGFPVLATSIDGLERVITRR